MLTGQIESHSLVDNRADIPRVCREHLVELLAGLLRLARNEIDQCQRSSQIRLVGRAHPAVPAAGQRVRLLHSQRPSLYCTRKRKGNFKVGFRTEKTRLCMRARP